MSEREEEKELFPHSKTQWAPTAAFCVACVSSVSSRSLGAYLMEHPEALSVRCENGRPFGWELCSYFHGGWLAMCAAAAVVVVVVVLSSHL